MRFAVIGLDHRHVYDLTAGLVEAGAVCAGFAPDTTDPRVLDGFRKRFPDLPEIAREKLLDDPSVQAIVTAAVPCDRAALAIDAMRRGKDVMADKPGILTEGDLAAVERAAVETGRIFSICFSERFLSPATEEALRLVRAGALGEVVQTVGLGPHRLNRAIRPDWFWDPARGGGILADIGSHQVDQFIVFTGTTRPRLAHASVGRYVEDAASAFDDFGEMVLHGERASGYVRVDWFTADGLPTWGDGRLTVLGTEGTIELRKNVDIAGRPGTDHLFIVDKAGTRHVACEGRPVGYFRAFAADVENRTETAMPQAHAFTVSRLAIEAQTCAVRIASGRVGDIASGRVGDIASGRVRDIASGRVDDLRSRRAERTA